MADRRVRVHVAGTVQGVGFRPFVHRLASELELGGFVLNEPAGALIEAEGEGPRLEKLLARLPHEAPPLARIEHLAVEPLAPRGERAFRIAASEPGGGPLPVLSADAATCDECLAELFDPADRRYRYPFINCTNCGPRFTIARRLPYDRATTTMASFEMCRKCRREYEDPGDRRFHAQANACPECGPRTMLVDRAGRPIAPVGGRDAVAAAGRALLAGRVVAVKGLGGYHLACRADDPDAVGALRERKHREEKPFALMAPDLETARSLVALRPADEALLTGRRRPIVIAPQRATAAVAAAAVAPRSAELGVMLPYSPLHHLLLAEAGTPLVMTSGNLSDEPIAHRDEDALRRLAPIADLLLVHDRPIQIRTDDPVVRATDGERAPIVVRRSRGYVPEALQLPTESRPLLAVGAELKSTFCLAAGGRAFVGQHIGDLRTYETLIAFREGIAHFERMLGIAPEVVAHDLHPDYLSTSYARERDGATLVAVQHHHAHLAACLAEHGEPGPAVGAIYDGTGLGLDGTAWGGELLVGDLDSFERFARLLPVALPGGDAAVREPWRMACAWLAVTLEGDTPQLPATLQGQVDEGRWEKVARLVATDLASPPTSSVGRLFDAVAALCGLRARAAHEGQAAMELEWVADRSERAAYPLPLVGGDPASAPVEPGEPASPPALDARETIRSVLEDLARGTDVSIVAARFHNGLAAGTAEACATEAERRGIELVALSGGVFQNTLLLDRTRTILERRGLRVVVPERLPPNDGGICFGQAAVAAARQSD
jgi:hydrogenase maturation protein HypF